MDFITSDTHFLHANSLNFEGCALRKSLYKTEEEMNEGIIRQWNKQARPNDTIFVLGDIACATDKKIAHNLPGILERLNGHIILVRGNHDTPTTLKIMAEYGHTVLDYYEYKMNKQLMCMSHYPFAAWNKQRYGSCQAFGHCHGGFAGVGRQMDVGWDNWARLLTVNEVFNLLMAIPVHITERW